MTAAERFERHTIPEPNSGCLLWTGVVSSNGYGTFRIGPSGPSTSAHRAAWILRHGSIARGLCVLHRCDVRSCVNTEHLFLGTNADNSTDMARKGRGVRGSMPPRVKRCGHRYGAYVRFRSRRYWGGVYDTPEEASLASSELLLALYARQVTLLTSRGGAAKE